MEKTTFAERGLLPSATGALLEAGWRRERSRLAARRLRGVVFIVVLQVVFDLMTHRSASPHTPPDW